MSIPLPAMGMAIRLVIAAGAAFASAAPVAAQRQMEALGRGVVAMPTGENKIYVGWRLLGTEPDHIAFNVYRHSGNGQPQKLNDQPITESTTFVDENADLSQALHYTVRPVLNDQEQEASEPYAVKSDAREKPYISIPLEGFRHHYVHLAWVGDLNGDGEYDYVVDRLPTEEAEDKQQQQNADSLLHLYYYDANTGEILRTHYGEEKADIGRGTAGDIDPRHRGYEYWAFSGIFNAPTGEQLAEEPNRPWPNFRIWWDGDVLSENLNREIVEKWNPQTQEIQRLLSAHQHGAVDSWRDAAPFYGDIIGDWREEVLFENKDHSELMIFTTTIPTNVRLYTLPHNPAYRAGMTVKGYMQSHMVDYYLGDGMTPPPKPNITTNRTNSSGE